ncbi:MAG: cohesin domain-containing protein [Patescibacteria group bacterium]|jgi:hypothetical protein
MRILFAIIALLFIPSFSHAATFLFTAPQSTIGIGETMDVAISLDLGVDEDVNAVEGALTFDASILELVGVNDARSVINLWAVKPKIAEGGMIPFAGIAPGGFGTVLVAPSDNLAGGNIFIATFRGIATGKSTIGIKNPNALLNDGLGTPASVYVTNFSIKVSGEDVGAGRDLPVTDAIPPESFVPIVAQEASVFEGKWFLVFQSNDAETGIARYEVREAGGDFVPAESPYLLSDQSGDPYVTVRAIDNAGNIREVALGKPWYKSNVFIGILLLVVFSVVIMNRKRLWRRRGH